MEEENRIQNELDCSNFANGILSLQVAVMKRQLAILQETLESIKLRGIHADCNPTQIEPWDYLRWSSYLTSIDKNVRYMASSTLDEAHNVSLENIDSLIEKDEKFYSQRNHDISSVEEEFFNVFDIKKVCTYKEYCFNNPPCYPCNKFNYPVITDTDITYLKTLVGEGTDKDEILTKCLDNALNVYSYIHTYFQVPNKVRKL